MKPLPRGCLIDFSVSGKERNMNCFGACGLHALPRVVFHDFGRTSWWWKFQLSFSEWYECCLWPHWTDPSCSSLFSQMVYNWLTWKIASEVINGFHLWLYQQGSLSERWHRTELMSPNAKKAKRTVYSMLYSGHCRWQLPVCYGHCSCSQFCAKWPG